MEIRNLNQQKHNIKSPSGKHSFDNAASINTTDAYEPGLEFDKPLPDLKRAAEVLLKVNKAELEDIWENNVEGIVGAADGERVVLGSYNNYAEAVCPDTGKLLWKSDTIGLITEGKDKTLMTSGPDKFITALNPDTGKAIWKKEFPSQVRIFDVADNGTVYARSGNKIYAMDPKTREITGECQVGGDPAIGKNGMVVSGRPDAKTVTALDFKTGEKKWEVETKGPVRCAPGIGKDGTVYAGIASSGGLVALDPDTGKEKWTFNTEEGIGMSPVVGPDGTVYVADRSFPGRLYAVDPDTGKEKWNFQGKDEFKSGIDIMPDGTVLAPTGTDIYALNPGSGRLRWSKKAKSYVYAPPKVGSEGRLYVGTNGHGMHCFRDSHLLMDELRRNPLANDDSAGKEDLQITKGKGFIDIGGVKLKVND